MKHSKLRMHSWGPPAGLAMLLLTQPLCAQQCDGVRWSRVAAVAAGWAVGEAAVFAVRSDEWWTTALDGFRVGWKASPSGNQDRLLHASISYEASVHARPLWRWACFDPAAAAWLSAALAVAVQLPKEIGDGLHEGNDFNVPDMAAVLLGAVIPPLTTLYPAAGALAVKYSYWPSPELLDASGTEPRLETDYAGQRYFLAFVPGRLPGGSGRWPPWLGLAVGHSVDAWATRPPAHEWYLSADVSLRAIPIRARWWPAVAGVLDHVHFPSPGIRLRERKVVFGFF